uniref:Outer membrane protein OmpA n=1 Tax=Candidatus Kentrum eta TaxID=2126337 RepID=A0A450V1H7_9GAMM|nr:MAG: Outer membrane protein OmpA [Candidatus Kentron sp. H]VFJ92025.1 MAG: Outer membrane protein OmpA [Candidatus Kentron sp. H]VFJ98619.1 MAG: Outer membrane protein OmpA [Candidatus Kentron sp. H]
MDEEKSISWIGFTDLFLYLFISILAIFIVVQLSFAESVKEAEGKNVHAEMMKGEFRACREKNSALEENLQQEKESVRRREEALQDVNQNLEICKKENLTTQESYRAYQAKERRERIEAEHGKLIADALNVLSALKEDMGSHLPIHIEKEPDRVYFDMGVSFKRSGVSIADRQIEPIIEIGKKFKEILDKVVRIDGKEYYLRDLMRVVVEGHADDRKVDEMANFSVSKDRAFRVMKLLIQKSGLEPPAYKINMAAFAEFGRQPELTEEDENNEVYKRKRMRRVTISIVPNYNTLLE